MGKGGGKKGMERRWDGKEKMGREEMGRKGNGDGIGWKVG